MPGYTIEYDPEMCILCKKCGQLSPKYWEMDPEGKASLKGSQKKGNIFILDIPSEDLEQVKNSAESCPMKIIHILDKTTLRHVL